MSTEDIYNDWLRTMRPLSQLLHEQINARHYPGTRQLCSQCDEPTGRCEDDSLFVEDSGPLCESCWRQRETPE